MPNNPTQTQLFEVGHKKQYYRIMAGKASIFAAECFAEGFIGVDFGFDQDLSEHLPDNWREFNREFIPVYLAKHPGKSKVAAGLACGMTHTVAKSLQVGDILLCPDGAGGYRIGAVNGPYQYWPLKNLPHRRPVQWFSGTIMKEDLSTGLRNSAGAIGTLSNLDAHQAEIEAILSGQPPTVDPPETTDQDENFNFPLEKYLEEFIVQNWDKTSFHRHYKIFTDDDGNSGRQYNIGDGRIDILAVSTDQKTLLVIELKRGRASDVVVGQTLRYMGYVKEVLADPGQTVKGAIIAYEDDNKLRQAIGMVPQIKFYRYAISFKLVEG